MPNIEIHEDEEWSAVYLDGKLQTVGDGYLADEWLREHFGVVTVQDVAFMRGQDRREGVAKTLAEVRAFAEERDEKLARAQKLRGEAARLIAEADEMSS